MPTPTSIESASVADLLKQLAAALSEARLALDDPDGLRMLAGRIDALTRGQLSAVLQSPDAAVHAGGNRPALLALAEQIAGVEAALVPRMRLLEGFAAHLRDRSDRV
jgi:hypothetical protein